MLFIVRYGFNRPFLPLHRIKSKQEPIILSAETFGFSIYKQFHCISRWNHINRFSHIRSIIPMTNNMSMIVFHIHPSVPHYLVCKEAILRDSQRIHHTAPAIILGTTSISLRIGKHNLRTSWIDTPACSGTLTPQIIPTSDKFHSQPVLILIICSGILSFVQRTISLFMKRITIFVPIFTQPLITTIFSLNHRMMFTFIHIKHFTTIFSLTNIQHLPGTYRPSSVRIILIPYGNHLNHVLTADWFISRFIK